MEEEVLAWSAIIDAWMHADQVSTASTCRHTRLILLPPVVPHPHRHRVEDGGGHLGQQVVERVHSCSQCEQHGIGQSATSVSHSNISLTQQLQVEQSMRIPVVPLDPPGIAIAGGGGSSSCCLCELKEESSSPDPLLQASSEEGASSRSEVEVELGGGGEGGSSSTRPSTALPDSSSPGPAAAAAASFEFKSVSASEHRTQVLATAGVGQDDDGDDDDAGGSCPPNRSTNIRSSCTSFLNDCSCIC